MPTPFLCLHVETSFEYTETTIFIKTAIFGLMASGSEATDSRNLVEEHNRPVIGSSSFFFELDLATIIFEMSMTSCDLGGKFDLFYLW